MKSSDLEQASRILRLIDQLTAEPFNSIQICDDGRPGWDPDWVVIIAEWRDDKGHYLADENCCIKEEFGASSLLRCLQDVMVVRGLVERQPPQTPEQAEETRMFAASVAILAVMRHLWAARHTNAKFSASLGGNNIGYDETQNFQIRSEMALAEQSLRPILERLAGYSWESLPESVKELCRQGGIIKPEAWTA